MIRTIRPVSRSLISFSADFSSRCFTALLNPVLSGHSKWSSIKHSKARNDAARNKLINKLTQHVYVATKLGGSGDRTLNLRLATAIELANKSNVPKAAIENAIKRGTGQGKDAVNLEQYTYELIGPSGVSLVIECLSDNSNRALSYLKDAISKTNTSFSPTLFNFEKKGIIVIDKGEVDEDEASDLIIDSGCEDYQIQEKARDENDKLILDSNGKPRIYQVITEVKETSVVANVLKENFKIQNFGIDYIPKPDLMVSITDADAKEKYNKLIDALESLDQVTEIYSNLKEEDEEE
ncbi:post-initiation translation factor DPC29 [Ascoidea rubescens DSM 1968]|uniref:DUF28-domain-containing protein n=1 Tax=Ascoidea rubescens DSM 1968 TaxID=1344418 RepID=A0A1D2VMS4_9ASCO|nr:DUF28-domain-containing protein [Ascoidea rubescens DSM 1968]ODV62899.1 DUF28-domain-containing protein [Ascoidea rubescens DSM 1968]